MFKQPTSKQQPLGGGVQQQANVGANQRRVNSQNTVQPPQSSHGASSRPSSSRTPQPNSIQPTSSRRTTSNHPTTSNNNTRLQQQSAHNIHTTKNSTNSKNTKPNEPLIRYHNLDDEEPEPQEEEEEEIETMSVVPSFGRNAFHKHVNINGDSIMKIRSPIIQTPVNILPQQTEHKVVIKPPTKLTDSISALTKQYRKLGDFEPTKSQPEKRESFSDEWSRKKQAALERRKTKSRNEFLARKVVDHWKWVARKGLDEIRAKNKRNSVLVFKTFQHWKRRKEDRDNMWKKEFIVQTRQKFTLMQVYFNQWIRQLEVSREREELYTDRAYSFLKRKLEHKVLKSLKLFVLQRKERREIIDIADTFANRRIIKTSLRKIKEVKIFQDKEAAAEHYWQHQLFMKTIRSIKMYIGEENYNKECLSLEFYNNNLKSKALRSLKVYQSTKELERQLTEQNNLKADNFFKEHHMQDYFKALIDYCKNRKQKQVREQTAITHYRDVNVKNFFGYWKMRTFNAQHFKELESIIQKKERKVILKMFFTQWKEKLNGKNLMLNMEYEAKRFFEHSIKCRAFVSLKTYNNYRQEKKELKNKSISFNTFSVVYKSFRHWKTQFTLERDKSIEKNRIVDNLIRTKNKKLMLKVLSILKEHKNKKKAKQNEEDKRVMELRKKLQRKKMERILKSWNEYQNYRTQRKVDYERAIMHYQRIQREKSMKQLYGYMLYKRRKYFLYEKAEKFTMNHSVKTIFQNWFGIVDDRLNTKCKNKKADFTYSKQLVRKTLQSLKNYVYYKRAKSKLEIDAMENRKALLMRRGMIQLIESSFEEKTKRMNMIERINLKSTSEDLKRIEKFARHWLYVTIRNAHKRGSGLFSGYRNITIQNSKEEPVSNSKYETTPSQIKFPKRRASPRRPADMDRLSESNYISNSALPSRVKFESIPSSTSSSSLSSELLEQEELISRIERIENLSSVATGPTTITDTNVEEETLFSNSSSNDSTNNEDQANEEQEVILIQIDKIKAILEEFDNNWTPVYEYEKERRKGLKELLDLEEDVSIMQEYASELSHLEKRAKSYLKFKREELPKLLSQLHDLLQTVLPLSE